MFDDISFRLRTSQLSLKVLTVFFFVAGIVGTLFGMRLPMPALARYESFMMETEMRMIGPSFLLMLCVGAVGYSSSQRVRKANQDALQANWCWTGILSVLFSCLGTTLYIGSVSILGDNPFSQKNKSLVGLVMVQSLMMFLTLAAVQLLLINLGLRWGASMPVFLVVMILSNWALSVFSSNLPRIVYYFWYPISPHWSDVVIEQVIPFIGFMIVMVVINDWAFNRHDYLGA